MNPHLLVIALYSVTLIGFGLWIGRRVRSSGDFFVAGRALGPVLLFSTVLAANIGAGTTVGAASIGYRAGLSAWWWVGSAGVGTLVLAWWVGPLIRRLAAARGFYTVGDLLEFRYGVQARTAMMGLLWVGTLAILAAQLIALAIVLETVVGIPKLWGNVIGGVVVTTYFAAGGLVGAAWINMIQLVVLLGAFGVAVPMALAGVGGWEGLTAAAPAVSDSYLSFFSGDGAGWIFLPLLAPAFIVSPGLLQKVYGGRNDRAVRVGVGLSALAVLAFAFAPALLGMTARVLHPGLTDVEQALPMLLLHDLPVWVGAIGLGALFMADISSADAILFMLSTSMSQDFYRRFVNPKANDTELLRVARRAAVGGGATAVLFAIVSESIVGALTVFYSLVGVILFVPVIAALYTGRASGAEAFMSFGGGIAAYALVRVAVGPAGIGVMTPNMAGLLVAGLGFAIVFYVRRLGGSRPRRDGTS